MLESADPGPVWVVLPTYNERDNLEPLVRAVRAELAGVAPDHTILVVDDSSPDGTGELADRLAREDPHVKVLHRPRKEGLGQAYLAGFEVALLAGAELILEMDADFSHDPAYLPRMIEAAAEADLVLGSRYVPGGGTRNWGRLRSLVSRGGCWYARTVLGLPIRDLTGGFKCFRREVLEAVDLGAGSARRAMRSRSSSPTAPCSWASGSRRSRSCSRTGGSGRARCRAGSCWRRCG